MKIPSLASLLLFPLTLCVLPLAAHADDDDHRGHRRHKHHGHKEVYWDGQCKVERKWKGNGEYKEKRKCRDRPVGYYQPAPVYHQPAPVYMAPRPDPAIVISPQIVIRP
ncbi:MAG: hypothetical protein ACN6O3_08525 [Comamonas sp.]